MTTQTISRRSLAAGLALAPIAGLPALAAAPEPDPIFAAIDRHRTCFVTFCEAIERTDNVLADQEGRKVTEADHAAYRAASRIEADALDALLATEPRTKAGARAALEHLIEYDADCVPEACAAFLPALLKSPVLADDWEAACP